MDFKVVPTNKAAVSATGASTTGQHADLDVTFDPLANQTSRGASHKQTVEKPRTAVVHQGMQTEWRSGPDEFVKAPAQWREELEEKRE
jgi:hypothetical protein